LVQNSFLQRKKDVPYKHLTSPVIFIRYRKPVAASQAKKAQEVEGIRFLPIGLLQYKRKRFLDIVLGQQQQAKCSGQFSCGFYNIAVPQQLDNREII
jgi:hypothetical protein